MLEFMLSYLMRQILLDALARGQPYDVYPMREAHVASQTELLTELQRRGLITSGPSPTLSEAGIAEATWFKNAGIDPASAKRN
jgi:hypothetical protein